MVPVQQRNQSFVGWIVRKCWNSVWLIKKKDITKSSKNSQKLPELYLINPFSKEKPYAMFLLSFFVEKSLEYSIFMLETVF